MKPVHRSGFTQLSVYCEYTNYLYHLLIEDPCRAVSHVVTKRQIIGAMTCYERLSKNHRSKIRHKRWILSLIIVLSKREFCRRGLNTSFLNYINFQYLFYSRKISFLLFAEENRWHKKIGLLYSSWHYYIPVVMFVTGL